MKRLLIILAVGIAVFGGLTILGASSTQAWQGPHSVSWVLPPEFDESYTEAELEALTNSASTHAAMFPQTLGSPPCERWGQVDGYNGNSNYVTADGILSWIPGSWEDPGHPEDQDIYVSHRFVYGGPCEEEPPPEDDDDDTTTTSSTTTTSTTTTTVAPPPEDDDDTTTSSTTTEPLLTTTTEEVPDLHVQFCHVGDGDIYSPANYTNLVLPREDAWGDGPDAHFTIDGGPKEGHLQDFYGVCVVPQVPPPTPPLEDDYCILPDGTIIEDGYVFSGDGSTYYTLVSCGPRPVESSTVPTAPPTTVSGPPALADTGLSAWTWVTLGILLVGVGGFLTWFARRHDA